MKTLIKAREIRVGSKADVTVKAAVLLTPRGNAHSVMLSRVSMWSAGQRAHASGGFLRGEPIDLHISWPMLRDMYETASKQHRRNLKKYNPIDLLG